MPNGDDHRSLSLAEMEVIVSEKNRNDKSKAKVRHSNQGMVSEYEASRDGWGTVTLKSKLFPVTYTIFDTQIDVDFSKYGILKNIGIIEVHNSDRIKNDKREYKNWKKKTHFERVYFQWYGLKFNERRFLSTWEWWGCESGENVLSPLDVLSRRFSDGNR